MKDSIITAKRKKTELLTLLVCFIIANLLNVYAIIAYDTYFKELFTQLGYVLLVAIALYILWSLLRIIFYLIKTLVFPTHI
jgi:hypothetical protein